MDPAVLIFLLYVMIAHELVSGWMQYRKQSSKPRKQSAGPLLCPSARVCQGAWRTSSQAVGMDRGGRDPRKSGRIGTSMHKSTNLQHLDSPSAPLYGACVSLKEFVAPRPHHKKPTSAEVQDQPHGEGGLK